jgi:hypothetical protein
MTIDEINARIKYISGQLDKDNPRRMTEGPFSEADKSVRDAYAREMELLEEEQIELFKLKDALEAAAPGEGEQLVANILSAYPIGGKRSKSVVGTVLGEELGALSEEGLAKAGSIEERLNLLKAPETETRTLYHRGPQGIEQLELRPDRFGTDKNALFFFDKPQKSGFGEALYEVEASLPEGSSIKIGSPPKELIEKLDAEIERVAGEPGAKTELNQLRGVLKGNKWFGGTSESRQVLREQGQVRSLTPRQSDFLLNQGVKHLEGINVRGIPGFFQNTTSIVLDPDVLNIMGVDGVPVAKEAEEGIMSLIGDTPTDMEEFQQFVSDSSALTEEELAGMSSLSKRGVTPRDYINSLSLDERLELYVDPLEGDSPEALLLDSDEIDYYEDIVDWKNIPDEYKSDSESQKYPTNNLTRAFLEKSQIMERREGDLVKDFGGEPYYQEVTDATGRSKIRVFTPIKGTDYGTGPKYSSKTFNNPAYKDLKDWLLSKRGEFIKSYKSGGYVMNYGDYGRSYK